MNNRRGFTLVELMAGLALFGLVMTLAWSLYVTCHRRSIATDDKLQRLQHAFVVTGYLERDLQRCFIDSTRGLSTTDESRTLSFHIVTTGATTPSAVEYRFDRSSGRLSRRCGDEVEQRLPGRFDSVTFAVVAPPDYLAPGRAADGTLGGGCVEYRAVAVASSGDPTSQTTTSDLRTTVCGSVALTAWQAYHRYDFWAGLP